MNTVALLLLQHALPLVQEMRDLGSSASLALTCCVTPAGALDLSEVEIGNSGCGQGAAVEEP